MESGVIGGTGTFAVPRVLVEHRADLELVPILPRKMEASTVLGRAKKCAPAITFHVQVMIFLFLFALQELLSQWLKEPCQDILRDFINGLYHG